MKHFEGGERLGFQLSTADSDETCRHESKTRCTESARRCYLWGTNSRSLEVQEHEVIFLRVWHHLCLKEHASDPPIFHDSCRRYIEMYHFSWAIGKPLTRNDWNGLMKWPSAGRPSSLAPQCVFQTGQDDWICGLWVTPQTRIVL